MIEHPAAIINSIIVEENSITIELANYKDYYEYAINGIDFQNSNQFSAIPNGDYTASVREKNYCNLVQQNFSIFTVPKYFTPNNDGFNDVWEISEMKKFPNSTAYLYDRHGKLIASLSSMKNSWNGKFNESTMPSDDYWYVLKLDDSKPETRGHFSLKR